MRKLLLLPFSAFVLTLSVIAENHSGQISANETWTLANSPHFITGNLIINDLITVNVEPGCYIYFSGNFRILVNGILTANGTTLNHIVFTSNQAVPANGDWRAILFNNADAGSILNYCDISYGGSDQAMVRIVGSTNNITISNCLITNSLSYGIQLSTDAANPAISNCTIMNCSTYPLYTRANRAKDIAGTMVFSGNNPDAIWVTTGTIETGQWLDHGVPYVLGDGDFTISDSQVLTIDPGNIIKFDGDRQLIVQGSMMAVGTNTNPITFTSNAAVPAPGNWENIYFNAVDYISELSYCHVYYGGSLNGSIYTRNNTYWWVRMLFSEIAYSASYGIYNHTTSTSEVVVCDIHDCNDNPIRTGANSAGRISDYCSFTNNTSNAIRVDGQNITGNWVWADNDIPFIIWGSVILDNGHWVELSPGVEIRFNAGTLFQISGQLIANGEPSNHIIFTTNQGVPTPGYWDRLYFYNANPGTILNYCDVSYGGSLYANIEIRNCSGNVTITNSTVKNSLNDGIYIRENSNPLILNSTVTQSGKIGVNIIGACIPVFGSDDTEWNEIFNNTGDELHNGTSDIEAKYIYWGSTYCGDVETYIYDKEDNATLGIVDYTPWIDIGHVQSSTLTVWTGATSTNWNTNTNWTNNSPCLAMNVSVPKPPVLKPVISTNEECHDLTIESGSRLTLNASRSLAVHGNFLMEAGAAGTASFLDNGSFSAEGNTTIRYYVEADRYVYVSPPMTNQTANTFFDMYLWNYDESYDVFNQIYIPQDPLTVGQGYEIWSSSLYPPPSPPGTKTVEFIAGTINNGSYSLPVTYTNTGWNLVGNPYPSAVDWDFAGWIKSKLDATVYVWDGVQFLTWNGSVGDLTGGVIPAMQAFFVKANAAGPGLTIANSTRLHGVDPYKDGDAENVLELTVTGNGFYDRSFIYFNENATSGFDSQFDAYKLPGLEQAPQLYTQLGENKLKVNAFKEITSGLIIPIGLQVTNETEYTLFINGLSEFTYSASVYLEDVKEGLMINLAGQNDYTFIASPLDSPDRFFLHFDVTGINDQPEDMVSIYSFGRSIYIKNNGTLPMNGNATIYNLLGQEIAGIKLDNSAINKIDLIDVSGYVVARVNSETGITTRKIFIQPE